jgi:hypothetical protein
LTRDKFLYAANLLTKVAVGKIASTLSTPQRWRA